MFFPVLFTKPFCRYYSKSKQGKPDSFLPDSILFLPILPVCAWSALKHFEEHTTEMAAVAKTAGFRDIRNGFFTVPKHFAGSLKSTVLNILPRTAVQPVTEKSVTFPFTDISCFCQI